MDRPDVINAAVNGKVPQYLYTCRAIKLQHRQEVAPKGYQRTVFSAEVIAPDIVDDVTTPEPHTKYAVAGRKVTIYLPIDPIAKQYAEAYETLGRLGYHNADGTVNLEKFWADIEAGTLFFRVQLSSEQQFVTDGAGKPIIDPNTSKPIQKGWRLSFVGPGDIIDRVETGDAAPSVTENRPF